MYTYSIFDKRFWVHQPNFVRSRHRYRGVRESEKISLETSQTAYDVALVGMRYGNLIDSVDANHELINEGGELDGVEFNWDGDATPSDAPLHLIGLEELSTRVASLANRVRRLEE